ncbi:MAG TPA: PAS domain-containing protein, partial [Nitrospirae bacterium]|nr:PAS domain-containing protein [Nitrospirota bacterium]
MENKDMPTYDELQQKVKEFEVQEEIFRTIIQQMEQLYAQVASSQSEIEKKNEAIEEEKGKLQAILKNIADALVVVNPGGRVILANSVFCDFFNADVNAVHNAHISEVIDNIELVKTILDVIEEPERTIMKQIQLQDGCFIKNTSSSILLDDLLLGVVSTFRDVTIEVQMDKMKTDFISTVSHELRTPLTSVLGFANIIKKRLEEVIFPVIDDGEARVSRAASQVRQNLDIIISEGERLTNLINDVLDIAKIEAGRVEWKDEDVDIAEVFRRAA